MYFYKDKGDQVLDLSGNLILSRNTELVKVRSKSAGPKRIINGKHITNMRDLTFYGKLLATKSVLKFIWKNGY